MPLSSFQTNRILKVTQELLSYSIAKMFAQPVDPVRDSVPNYFDIVKHPMDLGTIMKKINEGEYSSVSEWKSDVELVWSNSFSISKPKSLLGVITTEMQSIYKKLVQSLTDDPITDWNSELGILRDEFDDLTRKIKSPNGPPASRISSSKSVKTPTPVVPSAPSKKASKRRGQILSKGEILKLQHDIMSLTDFTHIATIIETVKKIEPNVVKEDDKLEVDLVNLQPQTLSTLREKVDQMLGLC